MTARVVAGREDARFKEMAGILRASRIRHVEGIVAVRDRLRYPDGLRPVTAPA
jgi:hypothetical protein